MKLNNIDIMTPSGFSIEPVIISRKGQTASGKATMEIIAIKRKFTLQWAMLRGSDYKIIRDIVDSGTFWPFEFPDNKVDAATATVYTDTGLKATLSTRVGDWIYTNAELILQEQ